MAKTHRTSSSHRAAAAPDISFFQNKGLHILLFLIPFLLYVNTIPNEYNLDDELVTNNHRLTSQGISAIPEIFTSPYYQDNMGYAYEYRPITLTSFAIENQFAGDNPHLSHFINVLLYGITAVLLFAVLYYILREYRYNFLLPLTAALLFIVHPIHTEVVASIKNRDELLCLMGGLGALYFALRYVEQKTLAMWGLFLLCFTLGVLAKRSILAFAVIIPFAATVFRQPKSVDILALTAPLAVFVPVFSPVHLLFDKVLIGLAIIVLPLFIHLLLHRADLFIKMKVTLQAFLSNLFQDIQQHLLQDTSANNFSTFHDPKTHYAETPSNNTSRTQVQNLNANVMGGGGLLCFLIASWGLVMNMPIVNAAGLLLLFFILFISDGPWRYWLIFALGILISFEAQFYDNVVYVKLLYIFIIAELLHAAKHRYPLLIISLLCPLLVDFNLEGWKCFIELAAIFALVVFLQKTSIKIILALVISLIVLSVFLLFSKELMQVVPVFFLSGLGIFRVWLSKYLFRFPDILLFISVAVLIPFNATVNDKIEQNETLQQIQNIEIQNPEAPQALPSDYRELEYVENPITHLENSSKQFAISFYTLGTYLQKLILPHPLNYYYGYRKIPVPSLSHPFVIGSMVVYSALVVASIYLLFRNRKILASGIGLFLVGILPFSNLLSPVAGIVGERLAYVASLGFCLAIAYVLLVLFNVDLKRAKPSFTKLPNGFVILMGILLLTSSFKIIQRNNQWEDHLTLFRNDIQHLQESAQAHNLLASHLVQEANKVQQRSQQRKMRQEAVQHFKKAVQIHGEFFNPIYDLGRTHLLLGNQEDAINAFERAIEVNPDFPNSYLKLANIYYESEQFDEAIPYYQKVNELLPSKIGAFTNLSFIYFQKGDYQKSIEVNHKALDHNPQAVNPRINLGKTYMQMDDNQKAIRYFEEAFELQPNNINVAKSLAQLYQEQGNNRKANYYKRQAQNLSQQGRR